MYSYLYFTHGSHSHKMKHYRHGVISRSQEKNCGARNSYVRNKLSNVYLYMYTYWKFINSKIRFLLQSILKTFICGSHSHTKCNSCEWDPSLKWSLTTLVVHSRGVLSFENPKCLVGFENALISGIWEYWNYWSFKNQLKNNKFLMGISKNLDSQTWC